MTQTTWNLGAYLAAKAAAGIRTDSDVADLADITKSRMSQIVAGAVPPEDLRKRLAGALGVRPGELWVEVELPAAKVRR